MRAQGATEAEIEAWRVRMENADREDRGKAEAFALPLDCGQAIDAFLLCATSWKVIVAGDRLVHLGLDYAAVGEILRLGEIAPARALLDDLRTLEGGAIAGFGERR